MKKISKLNKLDIYTKIFNPIFGYKVDFPKSWDIKSILNNKHNYYLYQAKIFPDIEAELKNIELKHRNGNNTIFYDLKEEIRHNILKERSDFLEKHNLYKYLAIPKFNISTHKEYIFIELEYENVCRNNMGKNEFIDDSCNNYIKFYKNGDIEISDTMTQEFRCSIFSKDTFDICHSESRYLSYSETIDMKEYFKKLDIDILN